MRPEKETIPPVEERRSGTDRRVLNDAQSGDSVLARNLERRSTVRRTVDRLVPVVRDKLHELKVSGDLNKERFRLFMENVGNVLADDFEVGPHEVGVFLSSEEGSMLRFAYPVEFLDGNLNMFPVAKHSIAGTVLRSGAGRISNNLTRTQHLVVYEHMKIGEGQTRRIQKMISAPLHGKAGTAIGVVEVSRKGDSPDEAGADFTQEDLKRLIDAAKGIGPFLEEAIPDGF